MKTKDNFTPWNQFDTYRGKEFNGEWPTIKELFHINTMRYPDNTCWKEYSPKEIALTYKEAEEKVKEVSSWFLSLGVKKGDKIIVSGKNSVAWAVTYIAVQYAGCTVVPLDSSLHDEDFIKFAKFSDSVVLVADNDRMKKVAGSLPMLGYASLEENGTYPSIMTLSAPYRDGHVMTEDDVAAILFTSGTTGTPKGVMLTNKNIVSDIFISQANMNIYPTDVFYAILPIHHAYTMLAVFMEGLGSGASVVFGKKLVVSQMLKELKEAKVTMFLGVPMIFNKLYAGLLAGVRKKGVVVYGLIRFLMGISGFLKKAFGLKVGKKMFGFLLKNLSLENCRICICGGGPLPSSTFQGFNELGLDFVQGYGLTETSPITHLNPIYAFKVESVGKNVALTEAKIVDADSEGNGVIYIKGPQVMKGYYKNQEATDEILDKDGWINTGDVGHIDSEGYLYLTGRAKSIIVTDGGKNVFPEEIEDKFQLYDDIEQICIIGYVKDKALKAEGIRAIIYPSKNVRETMKDDEIQKKMEGIISDVNKNLQAYKKISMVTVAKEPLEMTSTKKIKRFVVAKQYKLD
ncbi:MAG: AMP-binding protein [Spirochaetales bacterium]|nr:AMP-binding protein [Spirochaetales bacterium]